MSSILKALKRLEHEKVTRKPDSFRIDSEILRAKAPRRLISPSGAYLAAIALFLCGSGVTYLSMRRHDLPQSFQPAQSPKAEIKAAPPAAVVRAPKIEKSTTVLVPRQKNLMNSVLERTKAPLAYIRKTAAPQQSIPEKTALNAPRIVRSEQKSPAPFATPVLPAAPAVLKVGGIAFQEGSVNNAAFVNGVLVSKSSMIEGARVEEIQRDRVRFSRGSERFEILLEK